MRRVQPDGKPPLSLDNSGQLGRICDDADTERANADIHRLCRFWAEVGRAILLRRKQAGEEDAQSR
jgi:hypothetical protein